MAWAIVVQMRALYIFSTLVILFSLVGLFNQLLVTATQVEKISTLLPLTYRINSGIASALIIIVLRSALGMTILTLMHLGTLVLFIFLQRMIQVLTT